MPRHRPSQPKTTSQLEPRQLRHQQEERSRRRRKGTGNPTLQRQPCADKTRANSHGPTHPGTDTPRTTRPAQRQAFIKPRELAFKQECEGRKRKRIVNADSPEDNPPTKDPGSWPTPKRQPWLRRGRLQAPRLGHPAKTAELAEVHFRMGRKGKQKLVWISYPASFEDAACPRPGSKCHNKP